MPDKRTVQRARRDLRSGKSASTAAGEFVKREIDRIRGGAHGAKNAKQAIAIGLSEARRAGVPIPDKRASGKRKSKSGTRATRSSGRRSASTRGARLTTRSTSAKRSRAATKALKRQPRRAASHLALSRQAHRVARKRSAASRSASARKAARTRAQRSR
jgi:hypothetical protein